MRDTREHDHPPLMAVSDRLQAALAGRYAIERELGRGGMAVVYLARDLKHHRHVAVKVLHPELTGALGGERFLREIQIAARLQHPHILPLYDSGRVPDGEGGRMGEGLLYYVMPYVEGESLRARLARERQLPLGEALRIAREVADALAYAHVHGIIHRDVKPENILLSGEHALVADFGIAHAVSAAAGDALTLAGAAVGTPAYMSPEQATGDEVVDGRSDVYALGCVVYEMLAGAPPFTGQSPQVIVKRHLTDPPPPLRALRPTVPARVEAAVMRALAKLAADRFMTAQQFADALYLTGEQARVEAESIATPAPVAAPARRWRAAALAAAGVAVVVAVAVVVPRDGGAPRRAATDELALVVFPFQHRADAAPRLLSGDQCERLLYDALSYWSDLRLIDPIRMNEVSVRRAGAPLTLHAALADARALGAGRLVWGEVWEFNDTIRVRGVVYDVSLPDAPQQQYTVRIAAADPNPATAFDELASALLARRPILTAGADDPRRTRSFAAWLAFDSGQVALGEWNLARADSSFRSAIRLDPQYAQAYLWLARVLGWAGAPPSTEWRTIAQRALAARGPLTPRDTVLAGALAALADGQFTEACARYRALIARDAGDFEAWYGLGECHARDRVVVPDRRSPSGWRFRSSYETAIRGYARALRLVPSFQIALRGAAFSRLPQLLYTETNYYRLGTVPGRDTVRFWAWPALQHDTLVFIPYPSEDVRAGRPETVPPTMAAAVERNRRILRDVTADWVRASPRSPDALEALALTLETTGQLIGDSVDLSALAAIRRARGVAAEPGRRLRLGVHAVRLLVKAYDFAGARALADSLLRSRTAVGPAEARQLAGVAALTGRASRAADLLRRAASTDTIVAQNGRLVYPPLPLKESARALLAYAALGGPRDSLVTLARRVERLVQSWIEPQQRQLVHDALLLPPLMLAFPFLEVRSLQHIDLPLLRAQLALSRGDTAAVRARLRELGAYGGAPPAPRRIHFAHRQAWLLLAVGDTAAATVLLDLALDELPMHRSDLLPNVIDAAAVVRAMALRAELAARAGDRATAQRWAGAALALWSDADDALRPVVDAMRALASPSPPR